MVAPTASRVSINTEPSINERIRRQTEVSLCYYENHPEEIDERLDALDEEWDIERALETGSSALTLTGVGLGLLGSKKWLILSLVVQGFFMQHALQGWCPPMPALRRLGFRTAGEIEEERRALLDIQSRQHEVRGSREQQNQAQPHEENMGEQNGGQNVVPEEQAVPSTPSGA